MIETKKNTKTVKTQTKVYDHLFIAIFGKDTERSKRWRLELYNALNNTNYTDPNELELNTLENVIYIKMHNDVSFLIDSQMTLYEHQRTTNPNMPLRGFFYFAQLYQKYIDSKHELIGTSTIQKKCKPLYDYIRFVNRINENKNKGMSIEESVDEAVDWACELNLLEGYIREQKAEVRMNLLTEYDEEAYVRIWLRDGRMQQAVENAKTMLADNLLPEKVSHYSGLSLEQVIELQKQIVMK